MLANPGVTRFGSIEIFCAAAEAGSFTTAAKILGVTPAAVSRAIGRLEDRLKARLFRRTTRRIGLTDAGRLYFDQCRQALMQIEQAEQMVVGQQIGSSGLLRVSMPTTYAHFRVLPLIKRYCDKYPDVRLELNISNRNIDFVEEGYDLAIRAGVPPDSRLVARRLEDASMGVFAAPAYLKRRGAPKAVEDVRHHRCVQLILPSTGKPVPWLFRHNGKNLDFQLRGQIQCSDDVLGCVTLAAHGAGLTQSFHYIARRYLSEGTLTEVLKPFAGRSRPFSILHLPNRHQSAKVRTFVDFLLAEIARLK